MEHRIPFDERRLRRVLDLRAGELEAYLLDDHHTLAALAAHRGLRVDALADYLVAPWTGRVSARRITWLHERTMRLLTQGHLAQHVFFHVFHRFGLHPVASRLFGVNAAHLDRLRKRGLTPLQIARRHGGATRRVMIAALRRLVRARNRRAVAMQESWPSEARRLQARQLRMVPCWVRSLTPTADPGNPYGKGLAEHGPHERGWPATARARRIDEQQVETLRRHLRRSCWPSVHRWHWATWLARLPRPETASAAAAATPARALLCTPARPRTTNERRVSAPPVAVARRRA